LLTTIALLTPISFICLLSSAPKVNPAGIEVAQEDAERFKLFNSNVSKVTLAVKLFRKRGRGGEEQEE